jgi:hypothetical protein
MEKGKMVRPFALPGRAKSAAAMIPDQGFGVQDGKIKERRSCLI